VALSKQEPQLAPVAVAAAAESATSYISAKAGARRDLQRFRL
jgi:hypothetical protein